MQMWQKSILRLVLGTAIAVGTAWSASADQLGDGMFAYDQGLYREAFETWRPIAEAGDVTAQTLLAMVYERGEGVSRNPTLAAQWYERAAKGGHPQAQYQIGRLYRDGLGVDADLVEAFAWYSLAAAAIPKNAAGENSATRALSDLAVKMDASAIDEAEKRLAALRRTVAQH